MLKNKIKLKHKKLLSFVLSKMYDYSILRHRRLLRCNRRFHQNLKVKQFCLKNQYKISVIFFIRRNKCKDSLKLFFFFLYFVRKNLKEKLNLFYRVNLNLILENDFHFQWILRRSKSFIKRNKQERLLWSNKPNRIFYKQKIGMQKQYTKRGISFQESTKKRRWL
jgi:hypothetical protein